MWEVIVALRHKSEATHNFLRKVQMTRSLEVAINGHHVAPQQTKILLANLETFHWKNYVPRMSAIFHIKNEI